MRSEIKTHLNQVRHESQRQNEELCAVIGFALLLIGIVLFVAAFAVADKFGVGI